MKKQLKNVSLIILAMIFTFTFSSCDEDAIKEVIEAPFAAFDAEISEVNTLEVTFKSTSVGGVSYAWDFGDGTGTSIEENPTYAYTASGTYTVKLTVTNLGGTDDMTKDVTVSGFGENLVVNGDMAAEGSWVSRPLWTADDNATAHRFENGTFIFQNADNPEGGKFQWSNHTLFQEIALTAGSSYQLSADLSSTSGTLATWFEVFLVKEEPVDESNIGGDAVQFGIKSFGEGENCSAAAFDDDIIAVAQECTINSFDRMIGTNGQFTVTADDLSANGTVFLVFKAGSGFAPDGETAQFKDGIILDNVVIKEVL